jgi:hypothetical protein
LNPDFQELQLGEADYDAGLITPNQQQSQLATEGSVSNDAQSAVRVSMTEHKQTTDESIHDDDDDDDSRLTEIKSIDEIDVSPFEGIENSEVGKKVLKKILQLFGGGRRRGASPKAVALFGATLARSLVLASEHMIYGLDWIGKKAEFEMVIVAKSLQRCFYYVRDSSNRQ